MKEFAQLNLTSETLEFALTRELQHLPFCEPSKIAPLSSQETQILNDIEESLQFHYLTAQLLKSFEN